MTDERSRMLEGMRVIEVSAFVSAPFAGATLARLGADVIRVEQVGGGIDAQRWPVHEGRSLYRAGLDQGKRSVTVDLRSNRGRQLVADLICGGDGAGGIVITNLRGSGCLTYDHLRQRRPDLIMLSIKGTPDGRSAVDYTVNAGVGFPYITGPEQNERPVNHVLPAWDLLTGALAATSILAAEHQRRRTGQGTLIEIALSDVAIGAARSLGLLAEAAHIDQARERSGNDVYGTYGRDFRTGDGRDLMLCALTARQWHALMAATGITRAVEVIEREHDIDLDEEGARFEYRHEITALIEPWIATRTLDEVAYAFDAAGILWGPYRTFKELVASNPHVVEPELPAPDLGEDTEAILKKDLGLGDAEIADLRAHQVIG